MNNEISKRIEEIEDNIKELEDELYDLRKRNSENCICDYGMVQIISTPTDSAEVWFEEYIDSSDLYLKHRLILKVNNEEESDLNINYCPICGKRLSRPCV